MNLTGNALPETLFLFENFAFGAISGDISGSALKIYHFVSIVMLYIVGNALWAVKTKINLFFENFVFGAISGAISGSAPTICHFISIVMLYIVGNALWGAKNENKFTF